MCMVSGYGEARGPRVDRPREAGRRARQWRPGRARAPVAPVAPVTAGDGEAGDTLPVGDASGGGPSDSGSSPPHATSRRHAADADDEVGTHPCSLRTPDCNPASRAAFVGPASTDGRCSLTVHARPRARRRGAPRRAAPRRFVRRAVRRGEDVHVDPPGRRQGRGAHDRARPGRGRPRVPGDVVRLRLLEPAGSRRAAGRGRGRERRAPRGRGGRRGGPPHDRRIRREPRRASRRGVAGRRQGGVAPRARRRGALVQPGGDAGRRRLRRFAPARADRDVGRAVGRGGASAHPSGGAGRRRARREHPDRVPRARGVQRARSSSTGIRRRPRPRSPRDAPSRCSTRSPRRRGR